MRDWKARRKGDTYCAPACGLGCTWAAYKKAEADAAKLAKQSGAGWQPDVWENLGWHYAITRKGGVKVHPNGDVPDSYTAFLGHDDSPGGIYTGCGKTVQDALREAVAKALSDVHDRSQVLAGGQSALGDK